MRRHTRAERGDGQPVSASFNAAGRAFGPGTMLAGVAIYGLAAVVILRFGLLALAAGFCVAGFIGPPMSLHTGAWYFGNILPLFGSAAALAVWGFHTSLDCARLWIQDLFR